MWLNKSVLNNIWILSGYRCKWGIFFFKQVNLCLQITETDTYFYQIVKTSLFVLETGWNNYTTMVNFWVQFGFNDGQKWHEQMERCCTVPVQDLALWSDFSLALLLFLQTDVSPLHFGKYLKTADEPQRSHWTIKLDVICSWQQKNVLHSLFVSLNMWFPFRRHFPMIYVILPQWWWQVWMSCFLLYRF